MIILHLGNPAPLHSDREQVTIVVFPDGVDADAAFIQVTDPNGIWRAHSAAPAASWMACSDPALEERLCERFACPALPVPGVNTSEVE